MADKIDLAETLEALRGELESAVHSGEGKSLQFPVDGVQLEFQIGVTREGGVKGGLRFWVVELGARADYKRESIHKVTLTLGAAEDRDGRPVKVRRWLPDGAE